MPNLSELNLSDDAVPQIDWDAPESGSIPPAVYPGIYTLQFKMPEEQSEWFDKQKVNMVKNDPNTARDFLVLRYIPAVMMWHEHKDSAGQAVPNPTDPSTPLSLPPQKASFFKNERMPISQGGELLRALGIRLDGPIKDQLPAALAKVNGNVSFMVEVGWRTYFKATETTMSTSPRKKRGELAWPKNAQGQYELLGVNPVNGEKSYGYPEVFKIFGPKAA